MTLRCKVGDLAVVVTALNPENVGLFVVVNSRACKCPIDGAQWHVSPADGSKIMGANRAGYLGETNIAPDAWLRPIRPQSDDAKDESLAWLPPVPTRHKEPA